MKIKYCKNCIIPETRPNTEIGKDGLFLAVDIIFTVIKLTEKIEIIF